MTLSGTNANEYKLNTSSYEKTGATITKTTATNSVNISGINTYGQTLTANVNSNSDGTKHYQWWYSSNANATSGTEINGATSQTYKIGKGLTGKYIGVTVTIDAGTNWNAANAATDITDSEHNTTDKVEKKVLTVSGFSYSPLAVVAVTLK